MRDKKKLKWIGIFLLVVSCALALAWYIQDVYQWWIIFPILGGFYGFVWLMAWILRNNP